MAARLLRCSYHMHNGPRELPASRFCRDAGTPTGYRRNCRECERMRSRRLAPTVEWRCAMNGCKRDFGPPRSSTSGRSLCWFHAYLNRSQHRRRRPEQPYNPHATAVRMLAGKA